MKKIFVFSILASFGLQVQAQSLTVNNYTMSAGEKRTICIQVSADQNDYVGAGLILQLADGFSVESNAEGHWATTGSSVADDHITRASLNSEGRLKVAIYSPTNSTLNFTDLGTPSVGGEGQSGGGSGGRPAPRRAPGEDESSIESSICCVEVVAPSVPGTYNCNVSNIEYATEDYALITKPDVSFQIIVVQAGDVNGDGRTDVADLTAVVNYVLDKQTNGLNLNNADLNNDGIVSTADIPFLINLILGKQQ